MTPPEPMTTTPTPPKKKRAITALAPWYGGNRMLAAHVGAALADCQWVGVPFAGGMAEVAFLRARTIVANDLHRGVITLAECVQNPVWKEELQARLRFRLFHPDSLSEAQEVLRADPLAAGLHKVEVAAAYFVVAWMTRSGSAGTAAEDTGRLALRWEPAGGDSARRYRSAIDALDAWCEEFRRCTFSTLDCFEFLAKCKDRPRHGVYCDPPFPGPGGRYRHHFSYEEHQRLARELAAFRRARVVCRFYDHPIVRELYPASHWDWDHLAGRTQANKVSPEVLITNRPEGPAPPADPPPPEESPSDD